MPANLCYGIPDISLPRIDGGEINPGSLVGHDLVIFFCPADPLGAAREVEDYRSRCDAFERAGAWIIGVLSDDAVGQAATAPGTPHLPLACDPDGAAWAAFAALVEPGQRGQAAMRGTFLFARGGCLSRSWPGIGHAAEVLDALHRRS